MITLYGSGRDFGLPDGSPFVTKVEMLLRMAGLTYQHARASFRNAPRGKIPYIEDQGRLIGDSTLIRFHLEESHGADFSGGYDGRSQGIGWAVEKMLEEHLYFMAAHDRWLIPGNFARGPATYFKAVPALLRPLVSALVRRRVRQKARMQGTGLFDDAERLRLGGRALESISALLGENRYVLGGRLSGADATVYAFMAGLLCPLFQSGLRSHAEGLANIVAYERRIRDEIFPDVPRLTP